MFPSNFNAVTSAEHFQSLLSEDLERVSLINFWASWAEPCKQMNEVALELANKYPQILVLQVSSVSFEHSPSLLTFWLSG
jgi:thiol-disulfide isomerase/thioredoxin